MSSARSGLPPPQTLVVRAKETDTCRALERQETRCWDDEMLGTLLGRNATDHGLEKRVGSSLCRARIPRVDQTEESDLHLLTRLARDSYDALAKSAGGELPGWPCGEPPKAARRSGRESPRDGLH